MEFTVQLAQAQSKVIIKKGAHLHLKDYYNFSGKTLIISDENVPKSLKKEIYNQIDDAYLISLKAGETSKSMETYSYLLRKLLELDFSRKDTLVALGGGVIGDLVGFVASSFKRGCNYISIPTTTLSQIDSSIGGKVAINLNGIKNCVGAFYHPQVVIIDTTTLKSLPLRHFYNGLVEALKAGCIYDKELFDIFKYHIAEIDYDSHYLQEIIERSLLMKKAIVEQDEKEQNIRKILNFGHSIGHAIESVYNLGEYYHGECVGNGMIRIEDNQDIKNDLIEILTKMNVPIIKQLDVDKCLDYIRNDKKANGDLIDIVVVNEIGKAEIKKIKIDDLRENLERRI